VGEFSLFNIRENVPGAQKELEPLNFEFSSFELLSRLRGRRCMANPGPNPKRVKAMNSIGKATKWAVPFLVIAAMLIAAVPAAANGELGFEYWGWDASCIGGYVGACVYLYYGEGEPAEGIEVTFTMGDMEEVAFTNGGAWPWPNSHTNSDLVPKLSGLTLVMGGNRGRSLRT